MTTAGAQEPVSQPALLALHKQWAQSTTRRARLFYPEFHFALFESGWSFVIQVSDCEQSRLADLQQIFERQIKPVSCDVRLSGTVPEGFVPVAETNDFDAELWLSGEPLTVLAVNSVLAIAVPGMPLGQLDYDRDVGCWTFSSADELSAAQKAEVETAIGKIHLSGATRFVTFEPPPPGAQVVAATQNAENLDLATSPQLRGKSQAVQQLVEQDEDEWRRFLAERARQKITPYEDEMPEGFACLFDAGDASDIRLSELLTIYDRVDIMPERADLGWLEKHLLRLADLQELVRLKRLRLILPYSADRYPPEMLEALYEADPASLVLSRNLAAKTIMQGQRKDPLLYAPLTAAQRAAVLAAMTNVIKEDPFRSLLASYGRLFGMQHHSFMLRGALGTLGCGVGAYLGDCFYRLRNQDARIELMTCGAGLEWALALGASFLPRNFGGYDETTNSLLIASFLGRTRQVQGDPAANRMHAVLDGLLAVSQVPPLDVARNFGSASVNRFRHVARGLMQANASTSDIEEAVKALNADVAAFERRSDRLARWKVDTLLVAALTKPVTDVIDNKLGYGSIIAAWLYENLKARLPTSVQRELGFAAHMLSSLATFSSFDAVIVSRSKKALHKD
jgi:hypothetical protein